MNRRKGTQKGRSQASSLVRYFAVISMESLSLLSAVSLVGVLKVFFENFICDSVTYTEHARRKNVVAMDVVYALKRQGKTLYGFGSEIPTYTLTSACRYLTTGSSKICQKNHYYIFKFVQ